ncbi:hypothetical protein M758_9G140200 [Ceratodon purpureus]|nr:hypothetical protein M758_9G140200 [Ceratodon purpureus]KAG0606432.1 hypothetical protein M758_9G140200 [Ceratodon purpureus]
MSTSGYDGSEEIPMEPSGSGEKDDQGCVIMLERDIFGSGWDNVEQITRFVTSDVRAQAARSGEPDKFLQMMEGIVGNMVHSLELGSTPLCCSLVLYCAEEFERTQRPRLALHLYEMALGLSKQDCRMVDLTKSAKRGYEELVAAGIQREIDAGFPTWDTLPEKFIRGPYYRSVCDPAGEHVGYQICWEFEMKEGRENIPEINFSYCDYMRILHKGDRLKCLHGIMDQFTNYMEETPCMRGTPLHCSFLFLCAHEFKRMRKLEDAIKLFSKAQEFASQDPEMRILEKRACHTLAMMFSRDLHKERTAEPYFRRFVELVNEVADLDDFVELHNIGVGFIEAGRWEDAVTAHTKCLMMMSVAPSRFIMDASLLLMLLSRSYEQLDEHHAALLLVEQARLRAEMESCQCNKPCTECGLSETHDHKKTCVMHSILPRILAHQGRLQSRYRSWAEASETLEKGLELAKQADDHELISNLEHHLFEDILVAHNNLNLHMSGNFTLSAADLFTKTESFFHRLQLLKVPENDPFSEQRKDYRNRIKFWLDLRKEGASDRDLQALELNTIELARAKERGDGPWFLCISHLAVLDDLRFMHRSSDLEDIRYHFKEAVKCAASFADRTDMDAVNMRLSLGFHALTPRIQDLDEAVRLFTGVIQVVEKKLEQLATMSDDHALRFFEMTKHAYMYMTYTYIIYATRSQFVVNEAGYEVLANSSANSSSPQRMQVPDDPEMLRRALLWSERSKGRLLMKRLEQPLISINLDSAHVQPSDDVDQAVSDSAISNWEMTSLDREFHTDDDWAVDFIFRGNKFPHHGSKMVFVEFTMVSKNELATFIMNDHTGTIQGFRRSNLCLAIDETARKIAEEEMELLIRELHIYQKLDERAASTSKFPPALYAMNEPESRMLYFNPWIPGLVARFQRLTIEIQTLRESRQVRSPDGTTINDKMKQIDYLLTTLYKILIGPLEEAFRLLFEQCPDYTLVFVPHEWLIIPSPHFPAATCLSISCIDHSMAGGVISCK